MRFMAMASVVCASRLIEPKDMAPVEKRLTTGAKPRGRRRGLAPRGRGGRLQPLRRHRAGGSAGGQGYPEIKVELSDEVVRAQGRGKVKVLVLSVITAALGAFVGFTLGGAAERGKGTDAAKQGAADLAKDVEAANAKIEELAGRIRCGTT